MRAGRVAAAVAVIVALAAALVVTLAAGRGAEEVEAAPSPTPSASAEALPSEEPSPSPVAIPTPDNTGRDFEHVYREINAFHEWLYQENPDPELLGLIYAPDCTCYEEGQRRLTRLRDEGWHFEGDAFVVDQVDVVEDFEKVVRLRIHVQQPAVRLLSADGTVIDTVEDAGPAVFNIAVVEGGGGRWYVKTVTQVEGA